MTEPEHPVDRLPKWAQQIINRQQDHIRELRESLAAERQNPPAKTDPHFFINLLHEGIRPEQGHFLPKYSRLAVKVGSGIFSFSVRNEGDGEVLDINLSDGRIDIDPRASNVIYLRPRGFNGERY